MISENNWPHVTYESVPWGDNLGHMSRREYLRSRGPYNAAVVPFISDAMPQIPLSLITEIGEASDALTRFDAEFGQTAAPFSVIMLRGESASSSQIEHLTASVKNIALAELGAPKIGENAKLIVANSRAMRDAILTDKISSEQILEIHGTLLGEDEFNAHFAGKYRTQQVWIGGGRTPHTAAFVPPVYQRVPDLIEDLLRFMRRTDIPPLILIALAHAQFETIHPFPDGNGRTGRALAQVMLRQLGLTKNVVTPLSAGILQYQDEYIAALNDYRIGNIESIIRCFAESAWETIYRGRELVADIAVLRAMWESKIMARKGSAVLDSLEFILANPVVSVNSLSDALGVSYATALNAILHLEGVGILSRVSESRRNRFWQAPELIVVLEHFAAGIRRDFR